MFVEQPEIHLHPKAQGTVAELLAATSLRRQVVVETHSVHMINRARKLVAEGALDPISVVINFVERTDYGPKVHSIQLDSSGEFDVKWPGGFFDVKWPGGFFDERYEDTMALLRLRSDKSR